MYNKQLKALRFFWVTSRVYSSQKDKRVFINDIIDEYKDLYIRNLHWGLKYKWLSDAETRQLATNLVWEQILILQELIND